MANKQNKKNKTAAGTCRKKKSIGSGHLRGYLYMSFSFLPILFPILGKFYGVFDSELEFDDQMSYYASPALPIHKIMASPFRPILEH